MFQNMWKENTEKYHTEHHKLLLNYLQAKPKKQGKKICSEFLHIRNFVFYFLSSRKLQSFITSTCILFFPNPSGHST